MNTILHSRPNGLHRDPLGLGLPDRLRHVLIVGKTGTGKSTLLRAIAVSDLWRGNGLLLIDPHGDLAAEVGAHIPRFRKNDIVHFNATDPESCPGLNPLRSVAPALRPLVVSTILATIRKLFDAAFWGPRTEHVLRETLLALTEVRGATLDDARMMLVDDAHRRWVLRQVTDAHVQAFWAREFSRYNKAFGAEVTAPILNKLGALLASPPLRHIITKRRPVLDAERIMNSGRVVLASCPKGLVGEDATLLLGGLLLGAFQQSALARANVAMAERVPFFLIVDEAGSFASRPLLELLAEGRKYGVGLILATQSLAVLEDPVRAALLGNVGTMVSFRLGAEDAGLMESEFVHEFRASHLMRLAVGEMVVRIGVKRPVLIDSGNAALRPRLDHR